MVSALASAFITKLIFLVIKPGANYVVLVATIIQIIIVLSLFVLYLKQAKTRVGARRVLLFSAIPSFSLPLAYITILALIGGMTYDIGTVLLTILLIGTITTTFTSLGLMIIQSMIKDLGAEDQHESLDK